MPVSFDECFQTFPKLSPPADFDEFWKDAIKELKNFPVKNQSKLHLKSSIIKETVYDISYQSAKNYQINGNLVIPRRRGNLPVVIHFHDYMGARPQIIKGLTDIGVAQLLVDLRGHGDQLVRPEVKENETNDWTPGYFYSSAERKEDFYMKYLYLDVLRAIDFLRLTDGIDGDRIIIQGKSLGGALAAFGAAYSERVKAIVAETPNFSYVDDEQMQTEGPWVKELNAYLSRNRTRKASLKKTISYFDTLNFTDKIKVPALFSCGMDDRISNPKAIFAAFNHLNCDKRMQLYPNEGNEAGKDKQEKANLEFYKEIFNLNGT